MCSSLPAEAVAVGLKASRYPSSPSEAVMVGPKALSWHLSPLHHREPDWDSFLLPVLSLEPDWDSYVLPVAISELDSDWDLFGLLMYRQIVSQRPIICIACSNRSTRARRVRVPLLHRLQGSRGRGIPILARLDRPSPSISFRNRPAMNCPTLDRHFSNAVHD